MEYGIKKESRAARLAKSLGYTHIASVVKTHFSTSYFNVNSCDSVIESGKWIGASRSFEFNGQRMGQISSSIDWSKTITRSSLYLKLNKIEKVRQRAEACFEKAVKCNKNYKDDDFHEVNMISDIRYQRDFIVQDLNLSNKDLLHTMLIEDCKRFIKNVSA